MKWGHVIIEGYCDCCDFSTDDFPCKVIEEGQVGYYCLGVDTDKKCRHFGWCKSSKSVVVTDQDGVSIAYKSYSEKDMNKLKEFFNENE